MQPEALGPAGTKVGFIGTGIMGEPMAGHLLDAGYSLVVHNRTRKKAEALIGRGGGIKGNQHLRYPQDTPHANILVTMLNRAGVPAQDYEKFADNTGVFVEV